MINSVAVLQNRWIQRGNKASSWMVSGGNLKQFYSTILRRKIHKIDFEIWFCFCFFLFWFSLIRHCGLVGSACTWDGTSCEFNSWQCQTYSYHIPCSQSLRLLGFLWGSLGTYGLTQKLCLKQKTKKLSNKLQIIYGHPLPSHGILVEYVFAVSCFLGYWY